MPETYGPLERIRKKRDFDELYRKGGCFRGSYFNLIFLPNGRDFSRMAAVTSRKVGGAVLRNRARRRARELFRRNKVLLIVPMDILVIIKTSANGAGPGEFRREYEAAVRFALRRLSGRN